jgi:hypothetical protein
VTEPPGEVIEPLPPVKQPTVRIEVDVIGDVTILVNGLPIS